ncbi:phage virion morphogenesis protein [Zavarzinia compransoris]|uniref:Phage virion morphogenesis protein n=1 Tax=Zavarzinia compransoris TaxID=1264899 RepID=A0A317EAV3_9PROT|nr:phage virion morphogenesis protein [Zavarzinia compransoris]PWR23356.1 phage virion morphogenesis protein [Zavarzinia compransoris]TDP46070.1 phage virion morphogenesis protein [Zavarzinia compransoris]
MTGVSIKFDDAEVQAGLTRLAGRLDARAELLDAMGGAALADTQDNFQAEADPAGIKWAPLSKRTLERRGAAAAILRHRLRLYQSLTYRVEGEAVEVGTNVVYAGVHQFGGDIDHPGGERVVHFRFARKGAGKDGAGSRLRFAKRSTKAVGAYAQKVRIGSYKIRIPARPFLGVGPRLVGRIAEAVTAVLAHD